MNKLLAAVLLVILSAGMAGCVSAPPAPSPSVESDGIPTQTPSETTEMTPAPSETTYPASPDAAPDVTPEVTPEAAPADSDADPFFFRAPAEAPGEVIIRIHKGRRVLELVMDGEVAGRFPIGLGFAPEGDKERQGDGRTPVGEYYVCSRNDRSHYYLSLGVSYPNTEDARRGLDSGLIDQETYERIAGAQVRRALPDWNTPLGGEICIHAGGSQRDWTWGCVATEEETMDILWEYCPHGTPILICE